MRHRPSRSHHWVNFRTTIEIDVEVTALVTPGSPGRAYTRGGDPGYPPKPWESRVLAVNPVADGKIGPDIRLFVDPVYPADWEDEAVAEYHKQEEGG